MALEVTKFDIDQYRTTFYPFLEFDVAKAHIDELIENVQYMDNDQLLDEYELYVQANQENSKFLHIKILRHAITERMQ